MEYKNLLVITYGSFHTLTGSGISNTNLFKNWPIDKIANKYTI